MRTLINTKVMDMYVNISTFNYDVFNFSCDNMFKEVKAPAMNDDDKAQKRRLRY